MGAVFVAYSAVDYGSYCRALGVPLKVSQSQAGLTNCAGRMHSGRVPAGLGQFALTLVPRLFTRTLTASCPDVPNRRLDFDLPPASPALSVAPRFLTARTCRV